MCLRKERRHHLFFFFFFPWTILVYLAHTLEEESPIESHCTHHKYFPSWKCSVSDILSNHLSLFGRYALSFHLGCKIGIGVKVLWQSWQFHLLRHQRDEFKLYSGLALTPQLYQVVEKKSKVMLTTSIFVFPCGAMLARYAPHPSMAFVFFFEVTKRNELDFG